MCGVCGCGEGEVRIGGAAGSDGTNRHHHHDHDHADHHHHHDDRTRWLHIEQDILAKNDRYRGGQPERASNALGLSWRSTWCRARGPARRRLLTATARSALGGSPPMAVIEGDQETENDADRIRASGVQGGADQHGPGSAIWTPI